MPKVRLEASACGVCGSEIGWTLRKILRGEWVAKGELLKEGRGMWRYCEECGLRAVIVLLIRKLENFRVLLFCPSKKRMKDELWKLEYIILVGDVKSHLNYEIIAN